MSGDTSSAARNSFCSAFRGLASFLWPSRVITSVLVNLVVSLLLGLTCADGHGILFKSLIVTGSAMPTVMKYRFTFHLDDDVVVFRTIATHDILAREA